MKKHVGFDAEFGFRSVRSINGRLEPDITTGVPVCACLAFADGREMAFTENYAALAEILADPQYEFVVHGAHAEMMFCRLAGVSFPKRYCDTLLRGVLLAHATTFKPHRGAYWQARLAEITSRFGISFTGAEEKDKIRESIMCLRHEAEYGMNRVIAYCMADARACLQLVQPLSVAVAARCGSNALRHLEILYQPHAEVMARVAAKGIRFDQDRWFRLVQRTEVYRERQLRILRQYGYDHEGVGLGQRAFQRMIARLGLERGWPRTPTGQLRSRVEDLKDRRHLHIAIRTLHELLQFDAIMGQRLGDRVDRDGHLRCSILPFAQRSSRNSTVRPNLIGIPGELRPLLLPDEGCKFLHFDFTQQEPGIAGFLSGDRALLADFADGDVYTNTGRRLGLLTSGMSKEEVNAIRRLCKCLVLSIIYGKGAAGLSRDLQCTLLEARIHLQQFNQTYSQLFRWLRTNVAVNMERGWAENVIGYRAAFNVRDPKSHSHIARSCQNFPIQSSAATCFHVTGLHLAEYGADIRLGIHDAYLISVPSDPVSIANAKAQIAAATAAATEELFPGLTVRCAVEGLDRFAKDGKIHSLDALLTSLMPPKDEQCASA